MIKVLKIIGIIYLILGGCLLSADAALLLFAQFLPFSARPVLFPIGFLFLLAGGLALLFRSHRIRRAQRLKRDGVRITARITAFRRDRWLKINRRHPRYVLCEAQNPFGTDMRTFRSESIWTNPADHLAVHSPVTVYIDPQHPRRYHVDLEAALPCPVSQLSL